MTLASRKGQAAVLGSLIVSGALISSFAPAAQAANPVRASARTGPAVLRNFTVGPASRATSSNWSGYAATSGAGKYSKVSATWKEPAVTCTSAQSIAVFWVGIDGYRSASVEQAGTLAACQGGVASYYTWWEMYPGNAIQLVGATVRPGDQVTSSVVRTGSSYTLQVVDAMHPANSFKVTRSCSSCKSSSAEWIAERPSGSGGLYSLPNYATMSFNRSKATSNTTSGSISKFPHDAVTMVGGGHTLASVSKLRKQGAKFKDTWRHAS
jgi:hypothetical protein